MSQMGFFDADKRLSMLSLKGDPLEAISKLVPWEMFRADIESVVLTAEESRKSKAGRKPIDALVLLRMLVLQSLYNLSDDQIEYQVRDRLSFTRFVGLGFEDGIPDGTTLWLFREKLAKAGLIDKLFERSASIWKPRATSRAAGRWSMPRSLRCHGSATAATRTNRSRLASRLRTGRSVRRRTGRRTRMRAGRRSMGAASLATRTM